MRIPMVWSGWKLGTASPHFGMTGFDELSWVTQSGHMQMVHMDDWKLIYDVMGCGQLYHPAMDRCELKSLFGRPEAAKQQAQLLEELLTWTIRVQSSLPTGPRNGKYQAKYPKKHNWYAPYRHEHGTA